MTHSDEVQKMVKMAMTATFTTRGQKMSPTVTLRNGKTYFIDEKLQQLKNIENTNNRIDINTLSVEDLEEVKRYSQRYINFITIRCQKCRKILFTGPEEQAKRLCTYCPNC